MTYSDEDDDHHHDQKALNVKDLDEEWWTEEEDQDSKEEKILRVKMKTKRMMEEWEAIKDVKSKRRIGKFHPDDEDIQWENGPWAKHISGVKRRLGKGETGSENKSTTLKLYIASLRSIMG